MLERTLFDEEFLAVPCFRLKPPIKPEDLDILCEHARAGPLFADAKLEEADIATARQLLLFGFRKVCTQIGMLHPLENRDAVPAQAIIARRLALSPVDLCAHADNFTTSRHRQDTLLDAGRAKALYLRWVRNSTSGTKQVVHIDANFCTFEDRGDTRSIDLLSVLQKRRGIAKRLLVTLLADARTRGLTQVRVVTEAENQAAVHAYMKVGFRIETFHSCFHFCKR